MNDPRLGRTTTVRIAALTLIGLTTAACSTATPVVISAAKLPTLKGRATTSVGYTGEISTETRGCRGRFTGAAGATAAPLEMSCTDGRRGTGRAVIANGAFASGEVRLNDGTRMTIRSSGPTYP